MSKVYRTANGKSVDIDSLRLVNENTIAVGNMKVNARGDQLGPGGQVVQTRNQAMDQHYKIHTPMASEHTIYEMQEQQRRSGASVTQGQAKVEVAPTKPEVDPSGVSFDPPAEDPAPTQQLRGSLADSIAKQVTVIQETLTPLSTNNSTGPTRI